jgi:transglutaminase-like putative cysteine protease
MADISRIKSNVSFVDPELVTQAKLKITVIDGIPNQMIPTDSRQTWEGKTDASEAVLNIQTPEGPMDFSPTWPVNIKGSTLGLFTSSSPYIEASDKEISSTARVVVGNEKNAWKAAVKLADFVYNYVENKGFDTGFESAKQTFKDRKGDCKQHSVLLAALTRSLGIPTRIECGLAAVEDGYYYHMWTEVYVGQWVALDPTFNESRVDSAHIKLAETVSKEDELGDYAIQLLENIEKNKNRSFGIYRRRQKIET